MRFLVTITLIAAIFAMAGNAARAGPGAGSDGDAPGRMCSRAAFGAAMCIREAHYVFDVCQSIEVQARRHGLDPGFFARLIWQESRFDRHALSHAYAMGIAQFIAATAKRRGLSDPFNPAEALEYAAEYLGELQRRYGNPGLAAVAYNGGEERADGFLKDKGIASETIDYVILITGLRAEDWRDAPPEARDFRLSKALPFRAACLELATGRRITSLPQIYYRPWSAARSLRPKLRPRLQLAKWGAQLAFGKTEARARSNFDRVTRACRHTVGQEPDIIFVENRVRGRSGLWMARVSHAQRDAADDLCRKARVQGCNCAVYRNW